MEKFFLLLLVLIFVPIIVFATNPVLVDSGGTGDFLTVQAAINSWCTGGANVAETPPFTINIKAGSGPYDEALSLNDGNATYRGDIVGDLIMKSDTPGTKIIIKLQRGPDAPVATVGDDGLWIYQNVYNVTFTDLLFCPSQTTNTLNGWAAALITDDMVKIDENSTNAISNWISFYDCVLTDITTGGAPMVTSKSDPQVLLLPPTRGSGMLSANTADLLKHWGDVGEFLNLRCDNCLFYGGISYNCQAATDGAAGEQLIFNNCINAYAGYANYNVRGTMAGICTFSGTDNDDYLNCNFSLNPQAGGHCIYANPTATLNGAWLLNISNSILYSDATATSRGISAGSGSGITCSDTIIYTPIYNVVNVAHNAETWNRVTFHTTTASAAFYYAAVGTGSTTCRDCIFSGAGTKFTQAGPSGGISVDYCAYVEAGPDIITARGTIQTDGSNIVTSDPGYVTKNVISEFFMDVANVDYQGKGTSGSDLTGGADFYVPTAVHYSWSLYE